jgi:hypothetical protein
MDLQCPYQTTLLKNSSLCGGICDEGFVPSTTDDSFCVIDRCLGLTVDTVDNSICLKLVDDGNIVDIVGNTCEEGFIELFPGKCYIQCPIDEVDGIILKEAGTHCIKTKVKRSVSNSFCPAFYGFNGKNCTVSYIYIFVFVLFVILIVYSIFYVIRKNNI